MIPWITRLLILILLMVFNLSTYAAITIEGMTFHRPVNITKSEAGSVDAGGALFIHVRNTGTTAETINLDQVTANGVTTNMEWKRVWPETVQPGEYTTVLIKSIGAPISPGTEVTVQVGTVAGSNASHGPQIMEQLALRLGCVNVSPDWRSVYVFVRNTDTVDYTINSVFLNGDVTSQCTFTGGGGNGRTIPPRTAGVIQIQYPSMLPNLMPCAIGINATRQGGQAGWVRSFIRLTEPQFEVGTYSHEYARDETKSERGRSSYGHTSHYPAMNYIPSIQNPGAYDRYLAKSAIKGGESAANLPTPSDPSVPGSLPNYVNREWLRAWWTGNEPEIQSGQSPAVMALMNYYYWKFDPNHPTHLLAVNSRRFQRYGLAYDYPGYDAYMQYAPLQISTIGVEIWRKLEYQEAMKKSVEPLLTWPMPQGGREEGNWGGVPPKWGVAVQFWMAVMGGAKGIYGYNYVADFADPTHQYNDRYVMQVRFLREFRSIRSLAFYSDSVDNVNLSNSSGMRARTLMGKDTMAVVVVHAAGTYSNFGITQSVNFNNNQSGTLSVTIPDWIPMDRIHELKSSGQMDPNPGFSLNGRVVTFSNFTLTQDDPYRVFLIGGIDTQPPSPPDRFRVARFDSPTSAVLTWGEPYDNLGVYGYRLYRNGSQIANVLEPYFYDTAASDGAIYQIEAYDLAGNTSPKSKPSSYLMWDFDRIRTAESWFDETFETSNRNVNSGILSFDIERGIDNYADSYIVSPLLQPTTDNSNPGFLSNSYNYIHIRLKNQSLNNSGEVFWESREAPTFAESRKKTFTMTSNDSAWKDYFIYMGDITNWVTSSAIRRLRLDLANGTNPGKVEVDFIRLSKSPTLAVLPTSLQYGRHEPENLPVPSQQITLTNNGPGVLWFNAVTPIQIAGPNASDFQIVSPVNSDPMYAGESRVISVQFNPTSNGVKSANLIIQSGDLTHPTYMIPLSGELDTTTLIPMWKLQ